MLRRLTARWLPRVALLVGLALAVRVTWVVGHLLAWRSGAMPAATAFMAERLAALQDKNPRARLAYRPVPGSAVSPHLKRAVLAAEDARFRHHVGFDFEGIWLAAKRNVAAGRVVRGGSTISQQLAKNLFLSAERSFFRKAEEACITVALEALWSKERILDVYVNVIEWGDGVFGVEAAARHYFGVSAAGLTPPQAATLAAIIPSPRRWDRARSDPAVGQRAARIARVMGGLQLP